MSHSKGTENLIEIMLLKPIENLNDFRRRRCIKDRFSSPPNSASGVWSWKISYAKTEFKDYSSYENSWETTRKWFSDNQKMIWEAST